jgi:hypothetical protein
MHGNRGINAACVYAKLDLMNYTMAFFHFRKLALDLANPE